MPVTNGGPSRTTRKVHKDGPRAGAPCIFGLAAFGRAGVETALDILDSELRMVMRQADTPSLGRSRSSYMRDRRPPAW